MVDGRNGFSLMLNFECPVFDCKLNSFDIFLFLNWQFVTILINILCFINFLTKGFLKSLFWSSCRLWTASKSSNNLLASQLKSACWKGKLSIVNLTLWCEHVVTLMMKWNLLFLLNIKLRILFCAIILLRINCDTNQWMFIN